MIQKIKLPQHIHLYKRIDLVPSWKVKQGKPSRLVFACQHPTCNNTLPVVMAIGKLNECNICHRPFILDKESVLRARPRCKECIVRKNVVEIDGLDELLKGI